MSDRHRDERAKWTKQGQMELETKTSFGPVQERRRAGAVGLSTPTRPRLQTLRVHGLLNLPHSHCPRAQAKAAIATAALAAPEGWAVWAAPTQAAASLLPSARVATQLPGAAGAAPPPWLGREVAPLQAGAQAPRRSQHRHLGVFRQRPEIAARIKKLTLRGTHSEALQAEIMSWGPYDCPAGGVPNSAAFTFVVNLLCIAYPMSWESCNTRTNPSAPL
ncbi:hypothetical protein VOLCADRAFT_98452 [Volvox carteri f. nagariensis]|uniref:Uncharacterized protein n=1 Tax=Volvox carteri f. nagariensis TaxID=3068 RepID=D8UFD5_VOLCA|nr:uncharacterized protein VOLCADRAFT_98452 [Volvox carteri f. nagariensis]EFJ41555.1 hypothetical protein VOLCADRAFT_98452 [Volvox carteri f. nagariensis]|eukprot:XP_002957346.1 hypothetical protein VOLCADRAFT_98452 [Volvox carteri f. nagariensis]